MEVLPKHPKRASQVFDVSKFFPISRVPINRGGMSRGPKMLPSFTGIGLLMIVRAQFVGIAACFGIFLQQL